MNGKSASPAPVASASPWSRRHLLLRVVSVALPVLLLIYWMFFLSPRMAANIAGFWDAAQRADEAAAKTLQAAFDADHPTASTIMGASAACVLLATLIAAWPGSARRPGGEGSVT